MFPKENMSNSVSNERRGNWWMSRIVSNIGNTVHNAKA